MTMYVMSGKKGMKMSRLIDADIFKGIIGTETKLRKMVCDLIDSQPTVYDLDILISEFCVPLGFERICEELMDNLWGIDDDEETWCSRNCGKTNDGCCPSVNCYKEWIKMKKAEMQKE